MDEGSNASPYGKYGICTPEAIFNKIGVSEMEGQDLPNSVFQTFFIFSNSYHTL